MRKIANLALAFLGAAFIISVPAKAQDDYNEDKEYYEMVTAEKFEINGVSYIISDSQAVVASVSNDYTGALVIPESVVIKGVRYPVTRIRDGGTFYKCKYITSITLPNSLKVIGKEAFSGCSGLKSIDIPNSVTTIKNDAFTGCHGLEKVNIPNSVTSIGDWAFSYCESLRSITIPSSVTLLEFCAFTGCNSLERINVASDNPNYVDIDGVLCSKDSTVLIAYPYAKGTNYVIPKFIRKIAKGAFKLCSELESVEIPNSVDSIDHSAFSDCSSLTSITIPKSVTYLGDDIFSKCSSLTEIRCYLTKPIAVSEYTFDGIESQCTLMVPRTALAKFRKAKEWNEFHIIALGSKTANRSIRGSSSSLSWLNGTWHYSGYLSSSFGDSDVDLTVTIKGQNITVKDNVDGFFDYSGTWSIGKYNDSKIGRFEGISFGDSYFFIDRVNHRFGFDKSGKWFKKL